MKRIDFDLLNVEYAYLKLQFHKLNMSIKDFCAKMITQVVDEEEDIYWSKIADEAFEEDKAKPTTTLEEAKKHCGLM